MSTSLLKKLAVGPLLALVTSLTYRAALWTLGGTTTDGHVLWGLGLSALAGLVAWWRAFSNAHHIDEECLELRDAAEQALEALQDPDTAWTPAGTDARQALRLALGLPALPLCPKCKVDMGGHAQGCTNSPSYLRDSRTKGGAA